MRLTERISQLGSVVLREIDDSMHFLVPQQTLRFRHRSAGIGYLDVRSRRPFMEELTALGRTAHVHHRYGYVVDLLIPVHRLVEEGISERAQEEDDQYARVIEDTLHLIGEHPTRLLEFQPILI